MSLRRTLLAVTPIAMLVACTGSGGPNTSSTEEHVVIHNRLAANRLAANRLAANRLAANSLATGKLANGNLALSVAGATDLLATADGRDVLTYIVSCAAPDGTTFEGTSDGVTYTFAGLLGVAPEWLDHRLDPSGERWVSACLFARINAHDTSEEISVRGPSPALTVSPDEALIYTLQEGSFYGDLFTAPGHEGDPIDWNACRGRDQAAGEYGGLIERDCAEPDPADPTKTQCGFNYAGDCADYTPAAASAYACETETSGYYVDCHRTAGLGHWPSSPKVREVITTYVAP